jgi:hypothetical protein
MTARRKTSDRDDEGEKPEDEDLSMFGLVAAEEEDHEEEDDELFGVWPENWKSVQLFMACATQWDTVPLGGMQGGFLYAGLNYSKVRDTMEMLGVKRKAEMLEDLRVMEAEAKVVLNDHLKRGMKS